MFEPEGTPTPAHTPGPWFADRFGDIWAETGIDAPQKRTVDICAMEIRRSEPADQWQANARLIAAAPELLAALKLALPLLGRADFADSPVGRATAAAVAAIAKAEGRS